MVCPVARASGWGFFVHRHHRGVAALPAPLGPWMTSETEWLSAHAVDADKRKHRSNARPRSTTSTWMRQPCPAWTLGLHPNWTAACAACSEDTLWAYGVLPWNIEWTYRRLVEAMHEGDGVGILRWAADLGHYVGDAHVPLHTTLNYNGQLTGQLGIHGLWTRLPEGRRPIFLGRFRPEYISDVGRWSWRTLRQAMVRSTACCPSKQRWWRSGTGPRGREERGRTVQVQRVQPWCDVYHARLDGMVERQWRAAIHGVASLWWSAWIDAGQPDLGGVFDRPVCRWWQRIRGRCALEEDHD